MKKSIVILNFFFTTILCFCQSNDLPNRKIFTLKLAVSDSNFYEAEIKESSYLLPENTIQIYPGERIFVEVEYFNREIKSMKTVRKNINPIKTLIIKFSQEFEGKNHKMMMLSIDNPFKRKLEYKAFMLLMKNSEWVSTNVNPVEAELSSFELWPDIIVSLALTEWKFKD